ncbi:M48 family metallopeptidase [Luteolibacter luteus]|uniref:M48 family metalloprotease n=1 Tax=Luteolibacter luteus TaxID=2728835 RepID=A0A858RG16_9BACT|nr:M48 family metallopeptidase [Luteolibacter luteus]QJE95504.1 M48 family metalloprotease [Luteolibacter luteus]
MTDDQFDAMVASLEARYQGKHPALARRAAFLAILGYAGLAFFLIAGAAIALLMIAWVIFSPNLLSIKIGALLGIPAAILTWSVFRGLWVKLSAPVGVEVKRGESPALFSLIDSISKEAGGVNFDTVLLTGDMNAAVVQNPRLGVFGWYKTYLLLGVPLMDSMAPEEFKSVLAHEFAHLSHQHGRLGTWLYRLRASWLRVMASLAQHGAPKPVLAFINWFWPRFNASAFVLSRSQEYQADAFAAKVTSPQSSAMALQRLVVDSRRLDDGFWDEIGAETSTSSSPPHDVFHRMHAFLGTMPDAPLATRWLTGALAMKTNTADTHPGLKDRLSALGVSIQPDAVPPLPASRASDAFLEPALIKSARDHFSKEWHMGIGTHWQETHREKLKLIKRLEAPFPGTPDGRWSEIAVRARLFGPRKIQEEIVHFLADHPDHVTANYARGVYLAEKDDLAAIPHLEKATVRPGLLHNALGAMAGLYDRLGRAGEIPGLRRRAQSREAQVDRAMHERSEISATDRFLLPKLSEEEMAEFVGLVGQHHEIRAAWLVQKHVVEYPEWRSYFLVLDMDPRVSQETGMKILQEVVEDVSIDAHVLAIRKTPDNAKVVATIVKMDGSALQVSHGK